MHEQQPSRRRLLKAGGGTLLLTGLGLGAAPAQAGFAWSRAAATLLVGQQFWLNHPELRALALKLEAVQDAPLAPAGAAARQFNLVFSVAAQPAVAAGTYELEHPATGRQLLFLQAGPRQGARATLLASFNLQA
jgi:hypothetical protein